MDDAHYGCVRRSNLLDRQHPYSGRPTSSSSACSSVVHRQAQRQQHMYLTEPWPTHQQRLQQNQQCKQGQELHMAGTTALDAGALAPQSLEACVCIAINLSSRSLQTTMRALHSAYTVIAVSNDTTAADAAVNHIESLVEHTAKRVRLAIRLAQLQYARQAAAMAAAAAAAPPAIAAPDAETNGAAFDDTNSNDSSCISISSGPMKQQVSIATGSFGGPSLLYVQRGLSSCQQKQVVSVQLAATVQQVGQEAVHMPEGVGSSWE